VAVHATRFTTSCYLQITVTPPATEIAKLPIAAARCHINVWISVIWPYVRLFFALLSEGCSGDVRTTRDGLAHHNSSRHQD
jgi:hypothetical protein